MFMKDRRIEEEEISFDGMESDEDKSLLVPDEKDLSESTRFCSITGFLTADPKDLPNRAF
jgi:hypothetical protein